MLANTYSFNQEAHKFLNHVLPGGSFGWHAGNTRTVSVF